VEETNLKEKKFTGFEIACEKPCTQLGMRIHFQQIIMMIPNDKNDEGYIYQ